MVLGSFATSDWVTLLAGAVLLFNFVYGLMTGSAMLFYRTVKKSEDRPLYWLAVLVSAALGIGAFVSAVLDWSAH